MHTHLLFEKKWLNSARQIWKGLIKEKLSLISQGGENGAKVSFRAPGAFHHACWMANAIYGTNIFLFQQQFSQLPKKSTV